jgi:hypothetical protein
MLIIFLDQIIDLRLARGPLLDAVRIIFGDYIKGDYTSDKK